MSEWGYFHFGIVRYLFVCLKCIHDGLAYSLDIFVNFSTAYFILQSLSRTFDNPSKKSFQSIGNIVIILIFLKGSSELASFAFCDHSAKYLCTSKVGIHIFNILG